MMLGAKGRAQSTVSVHGLALRRRRNADVVARGGQGARQCRAAERMADGVGGTGLGVVGGGRWPACRGELQIGFELAGLGALKGLGCGGWWPG